MRTLACIVSLVVLAACGSSTAPATVHIVTQKSTIKSGGHIVLDQVHSWCNISDATVFTALAIGDVVPEGTCTWWETTAPQ